MLALGLFFMGVGVKESVSSLGEPFSSRTHRF
jgi:hypothetical protein